MQSTNTNKSFLEIQPKLWQSLYLIFKNNPDLPASELTTKLSIVLEQYGFESSVAADISSRLYSILSKISLPEYFAEDENPTSVNTDTLDKAYISYLDVYDLTHLLANETDMRIKKLLLAFTVYARYNSHPSNWIRYDKSTIFHLAGLSKMTSREQETLTCKLHQLYGLDMQVVGSTQPIPCFKLNWLAAQEPIGSEGNPPVEIGPFSQKTISSYVKSL